MASLQLAGWLMLAQGMFFSDGVPPGATDLVPNRRDVGSGTDAVIVQDIGKAEIADFHAWVKGGRKQIGSVIRVNEADSLRQQLILEWDHSAEGRLTLVFRPIFLRGAAVGVRGICEMHGTTLLIVPTSMQEDGDPSERESAFAIRYEVDSVPAGPLVIMHDGALMDPPQQMQRATIDTSKAKRGRLELPLGS